MRLSNSRIDLLLVYAELVLSVLAIGVAFHVLERVFPAERAQPFGRWAFNIAYIPFIVAAIVFIGAAFSGAIARLLSATGGGLLPPLVGKRSGPIALTLFALGYAFVWDISQYAMHRLQHVFPVLWETHRFHHDETALSAAAQARVHPTSYVLAITFHLPVIALFGPQTPHFVATFLMFRLWGFVNHANLRVQLGPLTPLVSCPQWHRIHHSALKEHRDRNFATFFPVIDLIFGTYYRPKRDEFPPTGLGERSVSSLRAATIAPFEGWYAMVRGRVAPLASRAEAG
jgi:sterol desaturase/sphingolipid hydroxylase (fatty acid hydroxylase superfamily)